MDDKITLLTWVIGLGGTFFAVLMGVMWSFILRGQQSLYAYAGAIREELKGEVDMLAKQSREDAKSYDERFARKDEMSEVKSSISAMRADIGGQLGIINTGMGALATQLANVVSLLVKK